MSQYVGLPYMAHASHAPDTTFIISEPDFVFFKEDAEAHQLYMSEQEAGASMRSRWEDLSEELDISDAAKRQYKNDLEQYLELIKKDKNAPWPQSKMPHASTE